MEELSISGADWQEGPLHYCRGSVSGCKRTILKFDFGEGAQAEGLCHL
jgi:hypothetical protein